MVTAKEDLGSLDSMSYRAQVKSYKNILFYFKIYSFNSMNFDKILQFLSMLIIVPVYLKTQISLS